MSTQILSGASSDVLTIDPTSKAGRVTLYDAAGNEIHSTPTGSYFLPINVRLTAALAAAGNIWTMRNGASKVITIRNIYFGMLADPTTSVASSMAFEFRRFSTATPTGGTALTPIKKRNTYANSTLADARFNGAVVLSVTSVAFEAPFMTWACPRHVGAGMVAPVELLKTGEKFSPLELALNEGLAIQLFVAAIIGDYIFGYVEYDER